MRAIYEVEFQHPESGTRFLRHVMADSPEDAVALAIERQGSDMPVLDVRFRRACKPGERERALRGGGDIPTIVLDDQEAR